MRVALIQPPLRDFYQTPHRHAALGCFSIKKLLERAGHQVSFYNFPLWTDRKATPGLPKELAYLKPFLIPGETGPLSWFSQRKHYGPSFEECAGIVLQDAPDLVMISCFAWCYAGETLRMAQTLREQSPGLLLETGGAGVSVNPGWFKETGLFNRVRTGPAEENLKDFPGMHDQSPPVTAVLTQTSSYRGFPQYATMLTRGCPARCAFCANHLTLGREFRKIPAQEILKLLEETGDEQFHLNLEDDNLLADKEYFLDFLDRFHARYPGATLSAENGLDYRKLDIPLADRLIAGGVIRFNLSLASVDSEILSDQNRISKPEKLQAILLHLEKRGIPGVTYFISGLPGDTAESVCRNILFLAGLPTETGISPFYAVPGLPGFEHPGENGLPTFPGIYCGSSVYPWNRNLTTSRQITAFRLSRLSNLLKSPEKNKYEELIRMVFQTRRLHTLCGKGKTQRIKDVAGMDDLMVEQVLEGFKALDLVELF